MNQAVDLVIFIGVPRTVIRRRVIICGLNLLDDIAIGIVEDTLYTAVWIVDSDTAVFRVVVIDNTLTIPGDWVISIGVDLLMDISVEIAGGSQYAAHSVHGGHQLVHRVIVVVRTHLVVRSVVVLVGPQEADQVAQPVKLPGGMVPHGVYHQAHEVQVVVAVPALAKLVADRHAAAGAVIAVLNRAPIRQCYNRRIRRHPLIAVPQRISIRVDDLRYTPVRIIEELIYTVLVSAQDDPHLSAVAILIIAVAGIPSTVIPLPDQIAAFIVGVVDYQTIGQTLLQKLAIFIIDTMKLPTVPVLLPNDILIFVKSNIFGSPVGVYSPLHQTVLIVVEEGAVILTDRLENSRPVTVIIEHNKLFTGGQELACYPARKVILIADILVPILVNDRCEPALRRIGVVDRAFVRKAGAGQQFTIISIADLSPNHICDGRKLALFIGKLQHLATGKFHALQGAAQIAEPHPVVVAVGDHEEVSGSIILILLSLLHHMQAEPGIRLFQLIGSVSCFVIVPMAILCTAEVLQVHIRQDHRCRLTIDPHPCFDIQKPSGAKNAAFVFIAGLIDTYQPEVFANLLYNEIGVSDPLAAGYHVNGVAAGTLLFLRHFRSIGIRGLRLLCACTIAVAIVSGPVLRTIRRIPGFGFKGIRRLHRRTNIPLQIVEHIVGSIPLLLARGLAEHNREERPYRVQCILCAHNELDTINEVGYLTEPFQRHKDFFEFLGFPQDLPSKAKSGTTRNAAQ